MQISGLQKITLVDFPDTISATVFTRGCSFRCPFCHNPELVIPEKFNPIIPTDEILRFLESRRGKLGGVCITGGEPLIHQDIDQFIKKIKSLDLKVKLDTNGSLPDKLDQVINGGNLDYIAMDIKTTLKKYSSVVNSKSDSPIGGRNPKLIQQTRGRQIINSNDIRLKLDIKKSIDLIMSSGIDYEFRTTVCHPLHKVGDFEGIGQLIKGAKRYYIQNFIASKHVDPKIEFKSFTDRELEEALKVIKKYIYNSEIR